MKKLQKKLQFLSLFLVAGLLFSGLVLPVKAFIQKQGTINEATILRQNADSASSQVMELANGQSVKVNNELAGKDGAKWYQIFVNDTTMGYVPASTVTISADATTGTTTGTEGTGSTTGTTIKMETVTVTEKVGTVTSSGAIRVRAQATTSSDQVASLLANATFAVLGEEKAADGYVWYQIKFDDNGKEVTGYVRSDLVKVEEVTREEQVPVEVPDDTASSEPQAPNAPYSVTSQVNAEGTTVWYLMDNSTGDVKEITSLLTPQETKSNNSAYKIIVVILLILLILAAAAATFFYMRWQDAEDFIAELHEKQLRARKQPTQTARTAPTKPAQGQSAAKSASHVQSVSKPMQSQPTSKPAGQGQAFNAAAQSQPTSKPAGQGQAFNAAAQSQSASKPTGQAQGQAFNVTAQNQSASKPAGQGQLPNQQAAAQATEKDVLPKTSDIVRATKQELQNKQNTTGGASQSGSWKSKNFLTDDDELDFDFLDMDDK